MKIIKTLMFLLFCAQFALAQNDTKLFIFYVENGATDKVLSLNKSNNQLRIANIASEKADFLDAFIIRPIPNQSTVYLIPANKNNLFLKRNGNNLEFSDIQTDSDTDKSGYEWELQYFGFPFLAITNPTDLWKVIDISNLTTITTVPNAQRSLSGNNDTKANSYRFNLKTISNTF